MVNIDGTEILVTRDLLGELSKPRNINTKKKDHSEEKEKIYIVSPLAPRRNWDSLHHHDLKPGKPETQRMYRRRHSPDSPLSSTSSSISNNHPLLPEEESCSLELKLNHFKFELLEPITLMMSSTFGEKTSAICTLDKVKSALERAKKRSSSDEENSQEERRATLSKKGGVMFAAGCPGCLLYVIASRDDPKCPRCNYSFSPSCDNVVVKKPRIDLN